MEQSVVEHTSLRDSTDDIVRKALWGAEEYD